MYELNFKKLKKIILSLVDNEAYFSKLCKLCDVKMTKKETDLFLSEIESCQSLHDLIESCQSQYDLNQRSTVILRNLMEDSMLMY